MTENNVVVNGGTIHFYPTRSMVIMQVLITDPNGSSIQINMPGTNDPMVKILSDGALEYGEGYEPNEAARIFWSALAETLPDYLINRSVDADEKKALTDLLFEHSEEVSVNIDSPERYGCFCGWAPSANGDKQHTEFPQHLADVILATK